MPADIYYKTLIMPGRKLKKNVNAAKIAEDKNQCVCY